MELIFKSATQADVDQIVTFSRHLNEDDPSSTGVSGFDEEIVRAALVSLVDNPELGRAWLIYDGSEPVGYVLITLGYSLEYGGRDAFIDELFITGGQRGRGIGTKAVDFVEAACRELGVNALHLEVEGANTGAQALYRKLGFEDHDRYLMSKWISTPDV